MKLTRRELALTAGTAVLLQAQNAAPPAITAAGQAQAARDANKQASDALAKFEIPMATEPAFVFKP